MNSSNYNLIVIKIGSSSLTDKTGNLDLQNLERIVAEVSALAKKGKKFIIVSSGAIVCGSQKLGLQEKAETLTQKQATAAIGQILLMKEYEKAFAKAGITIAQVLLTRDAIENRERYLNARHTFSELLNMGVVPIVNENDTVAVEEIMVGDNDNLAALVASLVGADLLINLTDVDGFYARAGETPLLEIKEINDEIKKMASGAGSKAGTGGMITKLQAAEICQSAGVTAIISNGRKPGIIEQILSGQKIGTTIVPKADKKQSRSRWIAHGLKVAGKLVIDAGAEKALISGGKSLLAVGVKKVEGKFKAGDLVSIIGADNKEIGRGLIEYNSAEVQKITGKRSAEISEILGYSGAEEVIHRDNLTLL